MSSPSQNIDRSRASGDRFCATWLRVCAHTDTDGDKARCTHVAEQLFGKLQQHYDGADRWYHTLGHISYCLSVFDESSQLCLQADEVELAIWFHDVIYDMRGNQNELRSAEMFMHASDGLVDSAVRQSVYDLILATDHRHLPDSHDHKVLADIDLSGFGLPWDRFRADGKNVRRELDHLGDEQFYSGQASFMQSLLARQPLYNRHWFRARYERRARSNIERYLQLLRDQGYSGAG